jgi:hypothetical protein
MDEDAVLGCLFILLLAIVFFIGLFIAAAYIL